MRLIFKKLLRSGAYAALLVGSAIAALTPDWATTLKAQSYAGYVDLNLSVQVDAPTRIRTVRAGTSSDLLVTIGNTGSADAHRPRTIAGLQGAATVGATSGCLEDPLGFPDCQLSAPLPAAGSADYLMTLAVSPLARGSIDLAVAATSDDPEETPGQELVQLHLAVEAHVDLSASARCNRPYLPANKPLSCQVMFRNTGQAATLVPYFYIQAPYADVLNVTCQGSRPELCPYSTFGSWNVSVMMPGEWATVTFDLNAVSWAQFETMTLYSEMYPTSNSEIEDTPADNSNSLTLPVPIFRDDFEGDPAPL